MNYTAMHRSNAVLVTDEDQVRAVIEEYRERDWYDGRFQVEGGRLAFFGFTTFNVFDSRNHEEKIREFLGDLQELIDGVLVIREVGYEGLRYLPDAGQWVVTPEKLYHEDLPGPSEIEIGTGEIVEG